MHMVTLEAQLLRAMHSHKGIIKVLILLSLLLCIGGAHAWRNVGESTLVSILGEDAHNMSLDALRLGGYDRRRAIAEKNVKRGCGVVVAESAMASLASDFYILHQEQLQKGWCKSFGCINDLVNTWFPHEAEDRRAFMRIVLYLELADTDWTPTCFDKKQKPSLEGWLLSAFWNYVRYGHRYKFMLKDTLQFSMMDYLVGLSQGVALLVLPTDWTNPGSHTVHKKIQGFADIFDHDLGHAEMVLQNKAVYDAAGQDLYAKLLQSVEDDAKYHWETEGLKRIAWGFQMLHEGRYGVRIFLNEEGEVRDRAINNVSRYRKTANIADPCMRDIFSALYDIDCDDDAGYKFILQMQKQYISDIFERISDINIEEMQKKVREELAKSWSVQVTNDFEGVRDLLLAVVNEIFDLEIRDINEKIKLAEGEEKKKSEYIDERMQIRETHRLMIMFCNIFGRTSHKKYFFTIVEHVLLNNEGIGLTMKLMNFPLKKNIQKMTLLERRSFLLGFIISQEKCLFSESTILCPNVCLYHYQGNVFGILETLIMSLNF